MAVKNRRNDARLVNNIKALCEAKGITVYSLSRKLDLAPSTLVQIANGQRSASAATLVSICDELGCTVGELLTIAPAEA